MAKDIPISITVQEVFSEGVRREKEIIGFKDIKLYSEPCSKMFVK